MREMGNVGVGHVAVHFQFGLINQCEAAGIALEVGSWGHKGHHQSKHMNLRNSELLGTIIPYTWSLVHLASVSQVLELGVAVATLTCTPLHLQDLPPVGHSFPPPRQSPSKILIKAQGDIAIPTRPP